MSAVVRAVEGGVVIRVKVVPGSRKEGIVGVLGDRLKVKVAAPPEDGLANAAVCALIAAALGAAARSVTVASGASRAEKEVRVEGIGVEQAAGILGEGPSAASR